MFVTTVWKRMRELVRARFTRCGYKDGEYTETTVERPRLFDWFVWGMKAAGVVAFGAASYFGVVTFLATSSVVQALFVFAVGTFVSKQLLFIDEVIIEIEALFWLLTARIRGTSWREMFTGQKASPKASWRKH
jgi:hypothetical protein